MRVLGSAVLATLLTGCGLAGHEEPRINRSHDSLTDLRYQWSSASGIDLLSGPAVQVRAYLESWGDAQATGSLDYAYPGFERAVAANSSYSTPAGTYADRDVFALLLRPDDGVGPAQKKALGNNRFRIQSVKRNGTAVTVTVCNYRYGMAVENDNGTFSSVAGSFTRDTGITPLLVRLQAPAESNAMPPQAGPAVAPGEDVFDGWRITGQLNDASRNVPGFADAWPTYRDDAEACVEQAPDGEDRRAFLINGEHPRSDFPTSPPTPGWPVPS